MTHNTLIIDDDPTAHTFYKAALAGLGMSFDSAMSGEEGYQKLAAGTFDLVLLDMMMPNGTGIDFLRAADLNNTVLPTVIMCSSIDERKHIMRALMLGATGYLVKPVKPSVLIKTISEHLFIPVLEQDSVDDEVPTVALPEKKELNAFTAEALRAASMFASGANSAEKSTNNRSSQPVKSLTLPRAMSEMVVQRKTGTLNVYTDKGSATLHYVNGRLQNVSYLTMKGFDALEALQHAKHERVVSSASQE
jgi:DNA-binding response OmpR family regulator